MAIEQIKISSLQLIFVMYMNIALKSIQMWDCIGKLIEYPQKALASFKLVTFEEKTLDIMSLVY